tara:strand:- start:10324 stop:10566 length:243 start_codon:yes stop_codon:yes gene_type:complete
MPQQIPPEISQLFESLSQPPKEGWASSSGKSPLKKQLVMLVEGLQDLKAETEKQHKEQLQKLNTVLRHASKHSSSRVRKK